MGRFIRKIRRSDRARPEIAWRRKTRPQPNDTPRLAMIRQLFLLAEMPKSHDRNRAIRRLGTHYRKIFGRIPRR